MSPGPNKGYHHGNLRAALIGCALEMLEKVGPTELSLRGLAAAAGVSRAAPYAHFADKEALLSEIASLGFQKLAQKMQAEGEQLSSARERFLAVGRAYVRFALLQPNLFKLMFTSRARPRVVEAQLLAENAGPYALLASTLSAYLEEADSRAVDGTVARVTAWSCVHGLSSLLLEDRLPLSPDRDDSWIDMVTSLFADALCQAGSRTVASEPSKA